MNLDPISQGGMEREHSFDKCATGAEEGASPLVEKAWLEQVKSIFHVLLLSETHPLSELLLG
jgi:hypothetical protein